MKIPTDICLLLLLAVSSTGIAVSQESDRNQPVQYSHDGNSISRVVENTRIVEMSDNVAVTQGSLEIFGDEAIFEYDAGTNELNRVTVHGTPVTYSQSLNQEGDTVSGRSDTIRLYTDENTDETVVELIGNAHIESPTATYSCVAITYVVERNLIPSTTGPCQGTLAGNNR